MVHLRAKALKKIEKNVGLLVLTYSYTMTFHIKKEFIYQNVLKTKLEATQKAIEELKNKKEFSWNYTQKFY